MDLNMTQVYKHAITKGEEDNSLAVKGRNKPVGSHYPTSRRLSLLCSLDTL